ncbi:MAG: translesion DNA synthesis-associated protein ImuA [Burkholderiaceae bacterium]
MQASKPSPFRHTWRATELTSRGIAARDSGFAKLNTELPGNGWPIGMLTELITREAGIGELRLLVPLLRQLTRERQVVILLAPPMVPYAPALASFGIDLDYLIVIQAVNAADRLWAVEQTLRSASFGCLLAWLPQKRTRPEHLRRLQLAAQTANGPVFLFRQLQAQFETSPAPLRLLLLPRANEQLSVQVLKRRGPVMAMPLMLDLPRPAASIQLKPSTAQPETHTPLHTIHARTVRTDQEGLTTPNRENPLSGSVQTPDQITAGNSLNNNTNQPHQQLSLLN